MDAGRVVINPLIYAEVSVGYETVEELDELLRGRVPAADPRRPPVPDLFPDDRHHRAGCRHGGRRPLTSAYQQAEE